MRHPCLLSDDKPCAFSVNALPRRKLLEIAPKGGPAPHAILESEVPALRNALGRAVSVLPCGVGLLLACLLSLCRAQSGARGHGRRTGRVFMVQLSGERGRCSRCPDYAASRISSARPRSISGTFLRPSRPRARARYPRHDKWRLRAWRGSVCAPRGRVAGPKGHEGDSGQTTANCAKDNRARVVLAAARNGGLSLIFCL
jgi:hypothetical protein